MAPSLHGLKEKHKQTKRALDNICCSGQVAQLLGALCHTPKGCRFDSLAGHVWEATNGCFSLTLMFPSLSLSLSFSLSNQFKKHFLRRGVKKFLKEKPDAVGHSGRFPQLQWSKLEGGRQPGLGNAETPGDKDPNLSPLRRNIKITLRANIIIFQALCNFFNFIEI